MVKPTDRRYFIRLMAMSPVAYAGFSLSSCGSLSPEDSSATSDIETVTLSDIQMEGWSTLGSGFLGNNGTLAASVIAANKAVTLTYVQDSHGHKFTLTPEHFAKLRRNEIVEVSTTEVYNHHHRVVINPAKKVPGSQPLTMPVDPDAVSPEQRLFAMLDESKPAHLYVSGPTDMADDSLEYCLDTAEACQNDGTLWQKMTAHSQRSERKFFKSTTKMALDARSTAEVPLQVRGKTKTGSSIIQNIMKLVKKI